MKRLVPLTLALALSCTVMNAGESVDLDHLFIGELAELERPETPIALGAHRITYPDGTEHSLDEKAGKVLLVNLWSAGCVPCRDEMPDLARLQTDLGDDRFEVVALPMEKRKPKSSRKILKSWKAPNLTPYGNDPKTLARVLRDAGLFTGKTVQFAYPTTYVVDRRGNIIAIREGFLDWDTPEARALINALKENPR